jgi:ketosteroid isomerase-like protein
MSESELAAARRAWAAFAAVEEPEQIGRLLEGWAPEVEYVEDPKWPGAASFRGFDAVGGRFRDYVDDLGAGAQLVLEDVRETPGGLVSLVRVHGRSTSGVPFDHLWAYRFRMRDRRIVWFRAYLDPDEALGAGES